MDLVFKLESRNAFEMVIEDIVCNLHKSNEVHNVEVESNLIDSAKDEVRHWIVKCNFEMDQLAKQMYANGWDQERVELFLSLLRAKKDDVFHKLILHHNSLHANTVTTFDWFLKFVIGSSEYKVLRYPLMQLIFTTINSSGVQEQKLYEISKESLEKLINILECEINDNIN